MPGVYLHIPFCKQACTYCDFHFSTNLSLKKELVGALVKEIDLRHNYLENKALDSIYFGGGTPSLLSEEELEQLLTSLSNYFSWTNKAEISLEINPDDVTNGSLHTWRKAGINRLSIGLQSFNDQELRWMNRAHTAEESLASVKRAQDAGFDNITIDLIYGSKFQTPEGWEQTLEQAIALQTQHISTYNLTIEDKTVLGVKHRRGKEPSVNEELSSDQFLIMSQRLREAGFVHYEVSNFGKPGFFAKHNSNYWLQQHYLGVGPSAHSFNGLSRQWNVRNNPQYIKALNEGQPFFEKEELSLKNRYNEFVLTRLRTIWGCDLKEMRTSFGTQVADYFKKSALEKAQFFDNKNDVYILKEQARLLADGIAADLFL